MLISYYYDKGQTEADLPLIAMRTTRPDWSHEVFSEFDVAVKETLESLLGAPLQDLAWKQAQLSTSMGGLGLRGATGHASAAFTASAFGSWKLCKDLDAAFTWYSSDLTAAHNALQATAGPIHSLNPAAPPAEGSELPQTLLSSKIDEVYFQQILQQSDTRGKARLLASAAPHAGAWLCASASRALGLHLTNSEFAVATQLRLGCCILHEDSWCPKCDQVLTQRCDHATRCRAGGDGTVRHNNLRDECFFRCLSAGWQADRELSGLLASDPRRRPADVFVHSCPGLNNLSFIAKY